MADEENGMEENAMASSPPTPKSIRSSTDGSLGSQNKKRASVKSGESGDKDTEKRSIDILAKSQEEFIGGSMVELTQEDRTSRRSQRSKGKSLEGQEDSLDKGVKLLPKARTSSRLTTSVQQQNQRRFREMIGKRELKNEELGKQKGNLRHRLDLLECSVPAVMLWNIWRMAQGAPVSSIQRVMKKQFLGPGSGEAYCPSTPSRHYDCRVREAEADRKLAEKRASEARSVLSEKQKLLDTKKEKLEEAKKTQQERQERMEKLTKEAKELKETTKDLQEDESCVAGECGEVECKRRLLARMSSSTSIRSNDVECLEKLQQLAESELMMKRQIEDLERREETYMKTLQQADDLWAKVEGDSASTMSALQELLDAKAARIQQLEEQLEDQLAKSTVYKSELQKYVSVETIEAAIGRDGDLAQVQDKSTAAKVKLKHRISGREWDLAEVDEKETLARVLGKDEGVSAVIAQSESGSHARPNMTDLGTDIPDDLIAKAHARMGIKSEDFPPEERYRQAMMYLDQIGSLSKLYDDDDWSICDPEHACQQDEALTEDEQLISVTSLVSGKTGESFHGKTSKDIGLAPGGTKYSGRSDLSQGQSLEKDQKPSRSILRGKESSKVLEKGPNSNQLRSWLETTNAIRSTIKTCPDCRIVAGEVDNLAREIASYTGSEGPRVKEEAKLEAEVKIELEEMVETSWKSKEKMEAREEPRDERVKMSKSDIPLDNQKSKVQDSDGTIGKPKVASAIGDVKEHPAESPASQKEALQLDQVPVKEAVGVMEVSSPAVKEIAEERWEDSTIREKGQEPQMVPVPKEDEKVTIAAAKDVSKEHIKKTPTRLEEGQDKIGEVTRITEVIESVPVGKSTREEVQESTEVLSDEVTEVVVLDLPEQMSSSMEKVVEPPPTPTDLKARAAASVTSAPEEIASRLEQHLKTPEETPTVVSDIIKDVISEEDARPVKEPGESKTLEEVLAVQAPEVQDGIELPASETFSDPTEHTLQESVQALKTESESTIVQGVELEPQMLPMEASVAQDASMEASEPVFETSVTKAEEEPEENESVELKILKDEEISKVESRAIEPLPPKLSKVVEEEEPDSEYREAYKRMEKFLTGPEVAGKPYLSVADIEIPVPLESQQELKEPCPCNVLELGPPPKELLRLTAKETTEIVTQTSESIGTQTIPVRKVIQRLDGSKVTYPEPFGVQVRTPATNRLQDQATITVSSIGIQTQAYPEHPIGPTTTALKAEAELRTIHYSTKPSDVHQFDCTCCACALKGPPHQTRPQPPPNKVQLASKLPIMLLSTPETVPHPFRGDQEFLHERLCTECKIKRLSRQRVGSNRLNSLGKGSSESVGCVCVKHGDKLPCPKIPKEMKDQSSTANIPKPALKHRSKWKEPSIDRVDLISKGSSLDNCICYDPTTTNKLSCKCGDPFIYGVDV